MILLSDQVDDLLTLEAEFGNAVWIAARLPAMLLRPGHHSQVRNQFNWRGRARRCVLCPVKP